MALRRTLARRLFNRDTPSSPSTTLSKYSPSPQNAITAHFMTSSDFTAAGFFRRFLQRRTIHNQSFPTSFLNLPVGEKLGEKLRSLNIFDEHRLHLEGLSLPIPPSPSPVEEENGFSVSVKDVKRVMEFVQLEKIKEKLRNIPASTIQYGELVRICGDVCGSEEQGLEFSKVLDESGNVIVLGGVVFLRPHQVAKSMEKIISQSITMPTDPRRNELERLEAQKAYIDKKAQSQVRAELYCGLCYLGLQTLGFMRLTFWELSWDVMEPICFFVTSLHFSLAYAFFLRTSKEPSFEGYFQRRFNVKQKKLMKIHKFDIEKYNQLCEVFNPNYRRRNDHDSEGDDHARETSFVSAHD